MFFDWKGIAMVIAALCAAIILSLLDLSCTAKPEALSTIARVKGELAAGRNAVKDQQIDNLTRAVRDIRVMARRYVQKGDRENARRAMNAAQELERRIEALKK